MTDINQNFSLYVGNDMTVLFDVGPDDAGLNLQFAQSLTWKAYAQMLGVPDKTAALISKSLESGITVTDPLLLKITVTIAGADTLGQNGNLYHEIRLVDVNGKVATLTIGLMTVIDPSVMPNVAAFKTMFPEFSDMDDTLVAIALEHAGQFVDETWGGSQADAVMYLAGHFTAAAHATADTDGRVVSSETIGRMSISYATGVSVGTAEGAMGMTRYGLVFNNMLSAQGFGIAVV